RRTGCGRAVTRGVDPGGSTVTTLPSTRSTRIWTMFEPTANCPLTSPVTVTSVRISPTGRAGPSLPVMAAPRCMPSQDKRADDPVPPRTSSAWWSTPIRGTPGPVSNSGGESTLTVLLAMGANLAVGAAKLVAGLITGSAAMLSEAAHSGGDTMTEVLLLTAL